MSSSKQFVDALTEFLDSELDDYDLKYDYEIEVDDYAAVEISRFDAKADVLFKYREGELYIDMHEDNWVEVTWFEPSVKYFWMLISPQVFV